jgi:hypothetical protein
VKHTKIHRALAIVFALQAGTAAAQVPTQPQPREPLDLPARIDFVCTEQPSNRVEFGPEGQVDYREHPPVETEPVAVSVVRQSEGRGYAVDAARIESDRDYLAVDLATWTAGNQITAREGRIRINLETDVLAVAEVDAAGNAAFRRFDCVRQPASESAQ